MNGEIFQVLQETLSRFSSTAGLFAIESKREGAGCLISWPLWVCKLCDGGMQRGRGKKG